MNKTVNEVLDIFNNDWNKQVILYGPPGTSKTYSSTIISALFLAEISVTDDENQLLDDLKKKVNIESENDSLNLYSVAKLYLEQEKERYKLVQFHPSYSYEDFVRGITVKPSDHGISYEVEPKILEKFCEELKGNKGVLVIDEINRAPLASVLGELIYGLEYRDHAFDTPYNKKGSYQLKIPENLYIIGTMNTADRSIGSIDYAVRRRFAFVPVLSNPDSIEDTWKNIGKDVKKLYDAMMGENGIFKQDLCVDTEMDVEDIKIGHTYFLGDSEKANGNEKEKEYLKYRIKYQIVPIYNEYIKDGLIDKSGLQCLSDVLYGNIKFMFDNDDESVKEFIKNLNLPTPVAI